MGNERDFDGNEAGMVMVIATAIALESMPGATGSQWPARTWGCYGSTGTVPCGRRMLS